MSKAGEVALGFGLYVCLFSLAVVVLLTLGGAAASIPPAYWALAAVGAGFIAWSSHSSAEKERQVRAEARSRWEGALAELRNSVGGDPVSGAGTVHEGRFYVYLHFDPASNDLVYVGKGTGDRDYSSQRTSAAHAQAMTAQALAVTRILDKVTERVALEYEAFLIMALRSKNGPDSLFNVSSGSHQLSDWRARLRELRDSDVPQEGRGA